MHTFAAPLRLILCEDSRQSRKKEEPTSNCVRLNHAKLAVAATVCFGMRKFKCLGLDLDLELENGVKTGLPHTHSPE